MPNSVNTRDELVSARLLDFFDSRTSWHRALWNPGLVVALKEIAEASDAVKTGTLSERALGASIVAALNTASSDCGTGTKSELKALGKVLRLPFRSGGLDYHAVLQIAKK